MVAKSLLKFREHAFGGKFRQDGRLLAAGDDEGLVKLFDVSTKSMLRMFRGHSASVHRVGFTQDMLHLASFSDDKSVRIWDISSQQTVNEYKEHQDYIRAGCTSPVSPNIILSGSYDKTAKLYDTRSGMVTFQVDHGHPVEALLFLPTGGIFLTAGGTEIKVWDAFSGCKLLAKMSQHHKTITSLCLGKNGKSILSGGLDRHVKVYDVTTYQSIFNYDFDNSVLGVGVSRDDNTLAVGMVDGVISVRQAETQTQAEEKVTRNSFAGKVSMLVDEEIQTTAINKQSKYDRWLRKYEYSKALDSVLLPYVVNKTPQVTVALMEELIRRNGLQRALAGRNEKSLTQILLFIHRYIGEQRFTRILVDVGNTFLDVYEDVFHTFTGPLGKLFIQFSKRLKQEESLTYDMLHLRGALELLLAGSNSDLIGNETDTCLDQDERDNLFDEQSIEERSNQVININ